MDVINLVIGEVFDIIIFVIEEEVNDVIEKL